MAFEYALVRAEKEILRVRSAYAPDEISAIASNMGVPGITNDAAIAVFGLLSALGEEYSLKFSGEYRVMGLGIAGR